MIPNGFDGPVLASVSCLTSASLQVLAEALALQIYVFLCPLVVFSFAGSCHVFPFVLLLV